MLCVCNIKGATTTQQLLHKQYLQCYVVDADAGRLGEAFRRRLLDSSVFDSS